MNRMCSALLLPVPLLFPIREIDHCASLYPTSGDKRILSISKGAKKRGFCTKNEFATFARWHAARNVRRCSKNDSQMIECATRIALSPKNKFERVRIGILNSLQGVDWPRASVFLHFGHIGPYPILDFCALWSLGLEEEPWRYSFDFWWSCVEYCSNIRDQAGTRMQTLDGVPCVSIQKNTPNESLRSKPEK
jgi:hypothetical protein